MRAKPVKGPFSNFFYARLRKEQVKPRRMKNPKGIEAFTWAVSDVRRQWARDLYYDARALKNLDFAIWLVPRIAVPLKKNFEYILEHEKAHTGSTHTPYPASKIKRIAFQTGRPEKAVLIAEQVANRGVLERILKETNARDFSNPRARVKVIEVLVWDLINASIRKGEFRQLISGKETISEEKAAQMLRQAKEMLAQLYPSLPKELIGKALSKFKIVYGNIITEAEEKIRKK